MAELADGRLIQARLAGIDVDEAAEREVVMHELFCGEVAEGEPLLEEVGAEQGFRSSRFLPQLSCFL